MYAVLGALLAFALSLRAAAQEPAEEPPATTSAESHIDDGAEPTTPSPAAALQARADAITALIDGSLDPSVDARALFIVDGETSGTALIEALQSPEDEADTPAAPPPMAAPDPLSVAREALRKSLAAFFALDPDQRESLLKDHEAKSSDVRREKGWAEDAERLGAQAEGLEALVAGAIEPGTDVNALMRVDALSLLPMKPPPEDAVGADVFARRAEAAKRLRNAYAAWLELSPMERQQRREAAVVVPEPEVEEPEVEEPEAEIPEAYVDERAEQDREDISDAEQKAADAAREKEEALDVARKARSEALRVVAEERARLLGIKEQQALFAAELPRWKQQARDLHETGLEWHRRVDEMASAGGAETDADELYGHLRSALDDARAALSEALTRAADPGANVPAPPEDFDDGGLPTDVDRGDLVQLRDALANEAEALTAEEGVAAWEVAALLRDDVVMLNRDRLRLLPAMSEQRRGDLTGIGTAGRAQARRELGQIALELRYHAMSLPRDVTSLSETIQERPFSLVVSTLELIALVAGFRWWRTHADTLLKRWRGSTWGLSRTPAQRFRSTAVWYLLKVRKPVEWLLLLVLLPGVVGTASNAPELRMIWLVLVWMQGGRAVIVAVDAIAERQSVYGGGPRSDTAELRYRSLRLIGVTVTAVGLILTLTSDIVGHGTIFRWVFQGCWVLVAPIGIWLVAQWRPTIVALLQPTVQSSPFAAWVVNNQAGVVGFLTSTVGGLWLLAKGLSAWLVRQFSGLDTTRKVLAYLFRREVARQAESAAKGPRGEPLRGALYDQLGPESQSTKLPPLDEPSGDLVARALELARTEACTLSVVVGERGMGKTTFLRRVVERSDETTCIVGCPPAGFQALVEALAVQFDAPDYELESVAKAIRSAGPSIICIDDAQRMIAPAVGGLEQLDRFTRFALQVGGDASWIVSVQEAAWHFVERARGDRVFFDQVLMLPRWSEDQISTLIQRRTNEAKLRPSFDALVVGTHGIDAKEDRRTEHGYYRILWDHSGGNPAVALQAWRDSLFVSEAEDAPIVRLFEEPSAAEVERLQPTLLFVLRAIVQLEVASPEEVADCTQLPVPDVADAIRFSVVHGYVELTAGRYRLSWTWYRTITRVLTRQHLLVH